MFSVWNVVAFYLFLLHPSALTSAIVIGAFVALTFAPIHFIHPIRVQSYQPWLAGITAFWAVSSLALLLPELSREWSDASLVVSLVCASVLLSIGALRTLLGPSSR